MTTRIEGLIAATFTPLSNDGDLDLEKVPEIVAHLQRSNINGIYINGSTGEGPSLMISERKKLAEAYVNAARGKLTTIVQIGTDSLEESRALASHAAKIGADGISSTPPCYFKPTDASILADCAAMVASGASNLPYFYYHIPALTGVTIDMEDFLSIAGKQIPNLAGIKFCSANMHEMRRCMSLEHGRYQMLSAWDEMLLSGLATGVTGAVGSTYNFAAPIYLKMIDAFNDGDMNNARLWQDRALEMIHCLFKTCGRAGLKTMMKLIGHDCGPHRLPIKNSTPEQTEDLRRQMEELGFFDWIQS